ncbi:hypothetical protein ACJX0J_025218 [Zea mays]
MILPRGQKFKKQDKEMHKITYYRAGLIILILFFVFFFIDRNSGFIEKILEYTCNGASETHLYGYYFSITTLDFTIEVVVVCHKFAILIFAKHKKYAAHQ